MSQNILDDFIGFGLGGVGIINSSWATMVSVQKYKNDPTSENLNNVVENTISLLVSLSRNDLSGTFSNVYQLHSDLEEFDDKWEEGNINVHNLQKIIAGTFSLAGGLGGKLTVIGFIYSTAGSIISSIINAQTMSNGENAQDVDIPLGVFFDQNTLIGFSAEFLNTVSDYMDSISFGYTSEIGGSLGNAAFWIWDKAIKSETMYERVQLGTSEADTKLGTSQDDYYFGLNGNDYLYGGEGKDVLNGGNGNDNLFGGDAEDTLFAANDNDELNGGRNNDYLNGGKGNDILDGGEDDDILVDESGNDTYTFSGNFGHDTIYDLDGNGQIKIDGVVIAVGEKINNHLWKSADGQYTLSLVEDPDGLTTTQQVIITKNNSDNSITIKYFNDGALGLTFGENEDTTNPPEDTSTYAFGTDGNNIIYDERYVASFAGNDYIQSTTEDAVIIAGDGNDFISTSDGNDVIYAGLSESTTDRDIILSGKGNDQIYGGAGNDLIMTSTSIYHPKQSILNDVGSASSGTTELNKEYEFLNSNYLVGRDGDNIFSYYVKNDLEQITEQILPFLEIFYSGEEGDYFFRNVVESLNYGHGLSGSDIAYGGSGNDIIFASFHRCTVECQTGLSYV